jgi:hypothetical protein
LDSIPIGQAVLQKVVVKLGGSFAAAAQLGVEPSLLSRFLDGTTPVPDLLLLRAVDIVLDDLHGLATGSLFIAIVTSACVQPEGLPHHTGYRGIDL